MGLATHLGPWALGTVKNTTGTALGTLRNMGATVVSQYKIVDINDPANSLAFVIPAGAQILYFKIGVYTIPNNGGPSTIGLFGSSITLNTAATTYVATEPRIVTLVGASALNYAMNVGTTDSMVRYTTSKNGATEGNAILAVSYVVRNADGTYMPSAFTGP